VWRVGAAQFLVMETFISLGAVGEFSSLGVGNWEPAGDFLALGQPVGTVGDFGEFEEITSGGSGGW